MVSADVDVKALVFREEALISQVPLSGEEGRVAGLLQSFGDGDFLESELVLVVRPEQFSILGIQSRDPIADVEAGRVLSGHDRGTCGRANGMRSVAVREANAARGQSIDIRRFVEGASVDSDIGIAQIIDEDNNEVGRLRPLPVHCREQQ